MDRSSFRIFVEPQQGATYGQLLTMALAAERLGFGAFFRSDHYLKMGSVSGLPGPTDAWITLAGLARETTTIRLGTMVTSATFRYPGPLAISVAQVDEISSGRVELGLGAGWYEAEHQAYAIPFPQLGERFERLEEQLAIITGLWGSGSDQSFTFSGRHYSVTDSPGLPKPVQSPRVPIIIGGHGAKRTPRLAATYADEFNTPFAGLDGFGTQRTRVIEACREIGRDPETMDFSACLVACAGSTEDEFVTRAAAIGRTPEDLRANGVCGRPEEVGATIARWHAAGAQRIYLQILDLEDLDHLDLFAQIIGSL